MPQKRWGNLGLENGGDGMNALTEWFGNLSPGGWELDLVVLGTFLTAGGVVWQRVAYPGLKTIWAAIVAAPRIAEGVQELVALVEGGVLDRLEDITKSLHEQGSRIDDHEARITTLEVK